MVSQSDGHSKGSVFCWSQRKSSLAHGKHHGEHKMSLFCSVEKTMRTAARNRRKKVSLFVGDGLLLVSNWATQED